MTKLNQTFVALMDEHGNAYPLFSSNGNDAYLAMSGASNRVALPADGAAYVLTANKDCWVTFGDNTVTAAINSGRFFLAGTEIIRPPVDATHIAAVTDDTSSGKLGVSALGGE